MVQLGCRASFPLETSYERLVMRHFWRQHFDGNRSLEREVLGKKHRTHPPTPHHLGDSVTPLEGSGQADDQLIGFLNRPRPASRI